MKRLLIIIALFLGIPASQAQIRAIWQKANHFLTQPELVDTTRIYQPSKACFSLGLSSSAQKAGFDVDLTSASILAKPDRLMAFQATASARTFARRYASKPATVMLVSVIALK